MLRGVLRVRGGIALAQLLVLYDDYDDDDNASYVARPHFSAFFLYSSLLLFLLLLHFVILYLFNAIALVHLYIASEKIVSTSI